MRISFDSNILIYAAHNDDRRHALAGALITRAAKADCILTLQSLGECFRVLTRKRGLSVDAASTAIDKFRAIFPIVAADEPAFDHAVAVVRAHRFSFWDALLWATVRRAGCQILLSEDGQDGRNLEGIWIVDPFKPENAKLVDLALPLLNP